ncbi:MAG TPA: hypothetical protein VJT73_06875 [Polyangiaceae bacterium]|nr:hypothetical protein [Polyangiaceae bacterium]
MASAAYPKSKPAWRGVRSAPEVPWGWGAPTRASALGVACALFVVALSHTGQAAWDRATPIRGMTVGPIESAVHPGKGYGSSACARTMAELARIGATWVSITPYGRVLDLAPSGIDWTFESPYVENRTRVLAAMRQAHENGLRVMLVPHLWVESGEWRGEIEPGSAAAWRRWEGAYRAFLVGWAEVAREGEADMLSVGVELRSWLTTAHASSFFPIIDDVRRVYAGPLTYSANWDDVDDTIILGALDVVGINAFYPLAEQGGALLPELLKGGHTVALRVKRLAAKWNKPVVFTELGYTTRSDPAVRPWEWPDKMTNVVVDERAQAEAYRGLLAPLLDEPSFMGFFVWRFYADPNDVSQESEWGFSPRGKRAELVVRDAYRAHWASDGPRRPGEALARFGATVPGAY